MRGPLYGAGTQGQEETEAATDTEKNPEHRPSRKAAQKSPEPGAHCPLFPDFQNGDNANIYSVFVRIELIFVNLELILEKLLEHSTCYSTELC